MAGPESKASRIAASCLAAFLGLLLAVGLARGEVDLRIGLTLSLGIVLGGWVALRGSLPSAFYDGTGTPLDILRPDLQRDGAEGHISARVYLPILLGLILTGIAAFALVLSR